MSDPIRSSRKSGVPIGFFIWTPYAPGSSVAGASHPGARRRVADRRARRRAADVRVRRGAMELQASEAQAQHLAFHDTLTGLPNRALFDDSLEQALAEVRRNPESQIALLYLDLDRFKHVNDTMGHPAGDELIREMARRLTGAVREKDTVARIGGDEFAIIQTGVTSVKDTELLCRRIIESVVPAFDLLESQVFVGISIGVAMAPVDALDRIELTRKADIALYHAKAAGRGRYVMLRRDHGRLAPATALDRTRFEDGTARRRSIAGLLSAALQRPNRGDNRRRGPRSMAAPPRWIQIAGASLSRSPRNPA